MYGGVVEFIPFFMRDATWIYYGAVSSELSRLWQQGIEIKEYTFLLFIICLGNNTYLVHFMLLLIDTFAIYLPFMQQGVIKMVIYMKKD